MFFPPIKSCMFPQRPHAPLLVLTFKFYTKIYNQSPLWPPHPSRIKWKYSTPPVDGTSPLLSRPVESKTSSSQHSAGSALPVQEKAWKWHAVFCFPHCSNHFADSGGPVSLHSVDAGVGVWTCEPLLPETRNQFDWKTPPSVPSLAREAFKQQLCLLEMCFFTIFNNRYCARWSAARALSSLDQLHLPELSVLRFSRHPGRFFFFFFFLWRFTFSFLFAARVWRFFLSISRLWDRSICPSVCPSIIDLASSQFCCQSPH